MSIDGRAQEKIRQSADPGPYELSSGGEDIGVLLIHGFTASPTETRPLANFIRAQTGWRCRGILLPGHGTTVHAMEGTTAGEWLRGAMEGYLGMVEGCSQIFLAGVSMGAVLCCHVALKHLHDSRIRGLVLMAPAFALRSIDALGGRLLSHVMRFRRKGVDAERYFVEKGLFSYTHVPLRKLLEMSRLGRQAFDGLDRLNEIPICMLAGGLERTVSLARIQLAASRHPKIRYAELPHSAHILTVEPDRQEVFELSLRFMREQVGGI